MQGVIDAASFDQEALLHQSLIQIGCCAVCEIDLLDEERQSRLTGIIFAH